MGSGEKPSAESRLRLERETLRDLAPTAEDAAAVRGGDPFSAAGGKSCPRPEVTLDLGPQTMMSYGCKGVIRHVRTEEGEEWHVDLDANDAVNQMLKLIERQIK